MKHAIWHTGSNKRLKVKTLFQKVLPAYFPTFAEKFTTTQHVFYPQHCDYCPR